MQHLNLIFEAIACIVFMLTLRKNKNALFYLLGFFVMWALIYGCVEQYYRGLALYENTAIIYVVYDIVSLCTYSFIFYRVSHKKGIITKVFTLSATIIIASLILANYIGGYEIGNYYKIKVLTGVYLIVLACYCLYGEFVNDDMSDFLIKKPGFWISSGVLIYYSGYSLVIMLHHFTYSNRAFLAGLSVHHFFDNILGAFLYTCLSVAMILCKPVIK